uniref:BG-like antigen 2 n=1 Tax=Meleagris gallopavo TaxID=9103 RepID=B1N1C6_MELGA|nr:BG-like antigen 2 [Meleagris gallopavo]
MNLLLGCNHPSFTLPWRTLLAHLVALHLLHLGSAQLRVVAPSLPVTAVVGQDVVLRCHLCPCKNAWNSDIRWVQHRSSGLVHHYQNGVDLEQMEEYKGRTELLRNGLSDGNLDLRITAVSSSDSGSYSCAVQDGDGYAEAVVNLEVSDPFSEIVHPWKVALAVVITILLGSFAVIIVFLHRKQVALSRELKRTDAKLAEQAAVLNFTAGSLKKQAAELVEQTKEVEKKNLVLKKSSENIDSTARDLKKQAAELEKLKEKMLKQTNKLEEQTEKLVKENEEVEKQNSELKKNCEKMDFTAGSLKILAAKMNFTAGSLMKQTEAVQNQNSELKKDCEEMGEQTEALVVETEESGKPSEEKD